MGFQIRKKTIRGENKIRGKRNKGKLDKGKQYKGKTTFWENHIRGNFTLLRMAF